GTLYIGVMRRARERLTFREDLELR
ncbi:hypothetical protein LCGC14_2941150, partial [marine sediment metagenome]